VASIFQIAQEHRKEGSVIAVGRRDEGSALPLKRETT
jgi:hypothetical protein